MNSSKVFQQFATAEIDNLFSITPPGTAETGDTLGGTYFTFYARDFSGAARKFVPYFISGTVGTDPTLGYPDADTIFIFSDSAGISASRYFTLNEGTSLSAQQNYVYLQVNTNGVLTGYDPRVGVPLVTNISTVGDTKGNLGGKYFSMTGGAGDTFYAYYIDDDQPQNSADPAAGQKFSATVTVNASRFATGGDSARADTTLNGNYFYLPAPVANAQNLTYFFPWFTNGNGVNPKVGRAQVQTLACNSVSDTIGGLAGKYFLLGDSNVSKYWWFQVGGGGSNPSLAGMTGKLISLTSSDSLGMVARKTRDVVQADSGSFSATRLMNTITITNKINGAPPVAFSAGTTAFTATVPINTAGISKDPLLAGDSTVGAGDSIAFANGDSAKSLFFDLIAYLKLTAPAATYSWTGDSVKKSVTITAKSFGNTGLAADGIYPTQFGITNIKKGFAQQIHLKNGIPVHIFSNASNAIVATQTVNQINQSFPSKFVATLAASGDTVVLANVAAGNVTAVADGNAPNNTGFVFMQKTAGVNAVSALATSSLIGSPVILSGDSNGVIAAKLVVMFQAAGYAASRIANSVKVTHKIRGNVTTPIANGAGIGGLTGWKFYQLTAGVDPIHTGGDSAVSIPVRLNTGDSAKTIIAKLETALTNVPLNVLINPVVQASGDTIFVNALWKGSTTAPSDGASGYTTGFTFHTLKAGADTVFTNMARNTGAVTSTYYIKPSPDQAIFLRKGIIEISIKGDSALGMSGFGDTTALPLGFYFQVQDVNGTLIGNVLSPTITTNSQLATLGQTFGTGNRLQVYVDFIGLYGGDPFGELAIDGTKGQRFAIIMQDNMGPYTKNFYFHGFGHYVTQVPY